MPPKPATSPLSGPLMWPIRPRPRRASVPLLDLTSATRWGYCALSDCDLAYSLDNLFILLLSFVSWRGRAWFRNRNISGVIAWVCYWTVDYLLSIDTVDPSIVDSLCHGSSHILIPSSLRYSLFYRTTFIIFTLMDKCKNFEVNYNSLRLCICNFYQWSRLCW